MDSNKIIDEIFPLVDNGGNVIGQATRSQCHNGSKVLHPVIHLHIFNTQGELYLQKRAASKDIQPNKWDSSVGGHIDLGEAPIQAALREAKEELGMTLKTITYIDKYIIETDVERELTYVFYVESIETPKVDLREVSEGRFWTINEIKVRIGKNIFTPNFEYDFEQFLQFGITELKTQHR